MPLDALAQPLPPAPVDPLLAVGACCEETSCV